MTTSIDEYWAGVVKREELKRFLLEAVAMALGVEPIMEHIDDAVRDWGKCVYMHVCDDGVFVGATAEHVPTLGRYNVEFRLDLTGIEQNTEGAKILGCRLIQRLDDCAAFIRKHS